MDRAPRRDLGFEELHLFPRRIAEAGVAPESLGSFLCSFWDADADDPCSGWCLCGDPGLKLRCGSLARTEVIEFRSRDASRIPILAGRSEHYDEDVFHAKLLMWVQPR